MRRSRLFIMNMPFDYYVREPTGSEFGAKPAHKYRVLLLVEYTNTPEDFEAQYPDYLRLMNEVHVLTDDMLLEYLGDDLSKCGDKAKPAALAVSVSAVGTASLKAAKELEQLCARKVATAYRFAGTGEGRDLQRDYDFSKDLKPGWLKAGSYTEQRAPAVAADATKTEIEDRVVPAAAPGAETPPADAPSGASAPVDPKAPASGTPAPNEAPKPKS